MKVDTGSVVVLTVVSVLLSVVVLTVVSVLVSVVVLVAVIVVVPWELVVLVDWPVDCPDMIETVLSPLFDTNASSFAESTATPYGYVPMLIVATTLLLLSDITETVSSPKLAT